MCAWGRGFHRTLLKIPLTHFDIAKAGISILYQDEIWDESLCVSIVSKTV